MHEPVQPQQQQIAAHDLLITIQVPRQALQEGAAIITWHLISMQRRGTQTEILQRTLLKSLLQAIQAQTPHGIGPTYRLVLDQLAALNQAKSEQEYTACYQWFVTNNIPIQQDQQTRQWKLL